MSNGYDEVAKVVLSCWHFPETLGLEVETCDDSQRTLLTLLMTTPPHSISASPHRHPPSRAPCSAVRPFLCPTPLSQQGSSSHPTCQAEAFRDRNEGGGSVPVETDVQTETYAQVLISARVASTRWAGHRGRAPSSPAASAFIEAGPFLARSLPSRMKGTPQEVSPGQDEQVNRKFADPREPLFSGPGETLRQPGALRSAWDSTSSPPRQPCPSLSLWFPQQNSHPWAISPALSGFYLLTCWKPLRSHILQKCSLKPQSVGSPSARQPRCLITAELGGHMGPWRSGPGSSPSHMNDLGQVT